MPLTIRAATRDDVPAIIEVMRASLAGLGGTAYDAAQIASALRYIAVPDEQLIDDGTYFVVLDDDGSVAGCGGWSRRRKSHAGSAATGGENGLLDPATEPAWIRAFFVRPEHARRGIGRMILAESERAARAARFTAARLVAMHSGGDALYRAAGYSPVADSPVVLEDGVTLPCTLMEKVL